MKKSGFLTILAFALLLLLLERFLPGEQEREKAKYKEIANRNLLEKQLVGKWNHNDFPAGMENNRNYYLLSADAGFTYRASDNGKMEGGKWSVRISDSVLFLQSHTPVNSKQYKINGIRPDHLYLQLIENDSLTGKTEWFRHP